MRFSGVLTILDEPSDKAICGSRGRRIVLSKKAAKEALHTLVGVPVNNTSSWDGHDFGGKIGEIHSAEIVDNKIIVQGEIFLDELPGVVDLKAMGMSYEMTRAIVSKTEKEIWTIEETTFSGVAILLKEKAGYESSSFSLE